MIHFKFENIPSRPVHLAQKYALIPPLLGETYTDALFEPSETRKALNKILTMWRDRLGELRKAGWGPVADRGWIHHANCPPPFAYTKERARPCTKYLVCPFCWCRQVVAETYRRAEHALYGTHLKHRKDPATGLDVEVMPKMWDVYEIVEHRYGAQRNPRGDSTIQKYVNTAIAAKSHYHKIVGNSSYGDFGTVVLEPSPMLEDDWQITPRYLMLVDPGFPDDLMPKPSVSTLVQRHKFYVTRETLAAAVGRVCRYPSGMLLSRPELALEVLRARSGITEADQSQVKNLRGTSPRLSAYYGVMRNKTVSTEEIVASLEE